MSIPNREKVKILKKVNLLTGDDNFPDLDSNVALITPAGYFENLTPAGYFENKSWMLI